MNDIAKGLTKIRNTIIGGFILTIVYFSIQLVNKAFNNYNVKLLVLVILIILILISIILLYNYFSGIKLIRKVNLVKKLNQRLDELTNFLYLLIASIVLLILTILIGVFMSNLILINVGFVFLFSGMIILLFTIYRTVQIQGILGVYANNIELKQNALLTLLLFKIQIVNIIVSNIASYFQKYLDIGYYLILIPSLIYSLYFLVIYLGLYNLSIKVYSKYEK